MNGYSRTTESREFNEVVAAALVDALGKAVAAGNWNLVHGCIFALGVVFDDTGNVEGAALHLAKVLKIGGVADEGTETPLCCKQAALWLLRHYERRLAGGDPERDAAAAAAVEVLRTHPSSEVKFMAAELLDWMCENARLVGLEDDPDPKVRTFAKLFSVRH